MKKYIWCLRVFCCANFHCRKVDTAFSFFIFSFLLVRAYIAGTQSFFIIYKQSKLILSISIGCPWKRETVAATVLQTVATPTSTRRSESRLNQIRTGTDSFNNETAVGRIR